VRPTFFLIFLTLGVLATQVGCDKPKKHPRCYTAADCNSNEICSELESGARTCLDSCNVSEAATCAGGAACVTIGGEDAQVDVCLPGGDTVLGATCAMSVECVSGAVCVQRDGIAAPRCERLCTTDGATVCVGNEACTPIDASVSPTRGTCIIPGV
jgi:hypothetical protein